MRIKAITVSKPKKGRTMNSFIQSNTILSFVVAPALVCFLLCPLVRAVVPAPDGGYPAGNTAEGQAALFSLTTGTCTRNKIVVATSAQ
jgi:hypothetical protein